MTNGSCAEAGGAGEITHQWSIVGLGIHPVAVFASASSSASSARRFQSRDAALLFGDHSSRFFDMARYSAAKIIVRYHIGEPIEVTSDLAAF